jgi:FkbM family methyltransferase
VISLSRIFNLFLIGCLAATAFYYYKTHYTVQQRLASLESYQFSDQRFLVQSRYGFPVLSLEKSLGNKESPTLPFIFQKFISPQATVLHLGAHSGLHTLLIAKSLKDKGKVLAFEGHPKLFTLLKENISLHNLAAAIETFPLIPSSKAETLSICFDATPVSSSDTAINGTYEQTLQGTNCRNIHLKTLDSLSLSHINFVLIENNIDVPQALEGAYELLAQSNWPPILIVPSAPLSQASNKNWVNRLKKEGYYFYKLSPTTAKSFKITQIDPGHTPANGSSYLLFSRELLPISIDK